MREQCPHALGAEAAEIEVEVAMDRHELADFDAGGEAAFAQPFRRLETGRVVVAGDIEAAQRRGQVEGGEVVGRKPRNHRQGGQHRFEREHGLDAFAGGEDGGGLAEADAVAEQITEGAARIGERRLGRPVRIEPGALDAGDIAIDIGDGGKQSRPDFERSMLVCRGNRPTGDSARRASRAVR